MTKAISLFKYFGGKNEQTKRGFFTPPKHKVICEPFAGSGAYAIWHACQCDEIVLNELDTAVYEIYTLIFNRTEQFLSYEIPTTKQQYNAIPDIGYRNWLSSYFNFNGADIGRTSFPPEYTICYQIYFSKPENKHIVYKSGKPCNSYVGHGNLINKKRNVVAMVLEIKKHCRITLLNMDGVELIRDNKSMHWTWFIDAPYKNINGHEYNLSKDNRGLNRNTVNYHDLANAIVNLKGHSITTEQDDANWLPFRPVKEIISGGFVATENNVRKKRHQLVVYEQG